MTSPIRILLIEDDPAQRLLLAAYLRQADFYVEEAETLAQSRALLTRGNFQLVLLDLNLPDGNGLDLAKELQRQNIPVIIVTSRPEDRIPALELGADDYLDKPYNPRELLARVQNLLRRSQILPYQSLRIGTFCLEADSRRLQDSNGATIGLTRGEFDLLMALMGAKGRPISRADLAEFISSEGSSGRSVDVLVSRLRQKLEIDSANPCLLLTVPGVGYRLHV